MSLDGEKVTELPALTILDATDLVYVIDEVGGNPLSRKITRADFSKYPDGTIIYDSDGNEVLQVLKTANAVNQLTLKNAATNTPPEIQASGDDTNVDLKLLGKGTGTVYGNRETWAYPLTNETTPPTIGVKYTTEPAPYNMTLEDVIAGLTAAGAGAALFEFDILKENAVNANAFTTIFSTRPTIDAAEFTSTTATTPPVLSVTTWEKGRRLQLSIHAVDTDAAARGAKLSIIAHATSR